MNQLLVKPGDVVVTNFGVYQHWALVTDRLCNQGYYMLISATKRNGTVCEEPWLDVTSGNETYITEVNFSHSVKEVLKRARSQIGLWDYSITQKNCEHFVKWASGLTVSSTQVKAGVSGAVAGAALTGVLAENPKAFKILGISLLVAGLAVLATKAIEKAQEERE